VKNDFDVENDPAYLEEHNKESPNLEKQLEDDIRLYVDKLYPTYGFKEALIKSFTDIAKSEVVKQYHQQGMFTEKTVRLILLFHAPYAQHDAAIQQFKKIKP
jgi:hypothetical protein